MKLSFGVSSVALFLLSVLCLILLTLFESSLVGLSLTQQRIVSFLILVLPAVIGTVLEILSVRRKESRRWFGILGTILNGLFALFHIFLLSFAG